MRFKLEHHFPCSPETYWELAARDDIDKESAAAADGEVEILSRSEQDGVLTRRQRFVMHRSLPKPMLKVLKTDEIGYELEVRLTRANNRAEWTITPLVLPDRVTGGGSVILTATDTGCIRIIDGDLTVRVSLLGKQMEKRLIGEVSDSYDRNAEVIRKHLAAQSDEQH